MTKAQDKQEEFVEIIENAKKKSESLDLNFLKKLPVEMTKPQSIPFPYGSGSAKPYGWYSN